MSTAVEPLSHHARFIRRLACELARREGVDAEDLVQETYVAVLERRPERPEHLRPWLRRVMSGLALTQQRRAFRRREVEADAEVPRSGESGARHASRAELRHLLAREVGTLAPHYRETLVLRFYDDLSHREIAARLGIAVETVTTRLRRGLDQLAQRLRRQPELRQPLHLALAPLIAPDPTQAARPRTPWPWLAAAGLTLLLAPVLAPRPAAAPPVPGPWSREAHLSSVDHQATCGPLGEPRPVELELNIDLAAGTTLVRGEFRSSSGDELIHAPFDTPTSGGGVPGWRPDTGLPLAPHLRTWLLGPASAAQVVDHNQVLRGTYARPLELWFAQPDPEHQDLVRVDSLPHRAEGSSQRAVVFDLGGRVDGLSCLLPIDDRLTVERHQSVARWSGEGVLTLDASGAVVGVQLAGELVVTEEAWAEVEGEEEPARIRRRSRFEGRLDLRYGGPPTP